MPQQSDNPAQGLIDRLKQWTGKADKPAPAPKPDTSWHDAQVKKANDSFAKSAQDKQPAGKTPVATGNNASSGTSAPSGQVPSYKKGGMIKKTGLAKLHAGEKVIRKQDVKKTVKAVRKYGGKR